MNELTLKLRTCSESRIEKGVALIFVEAVDNDFMMFTFKMGVKDFKKHSKKIKQGIEFKYTVRLIPILLNGWIVSYSAEMDEDSLYLCSEQLGVI